jgi:hypothetical protein
LYGILKKLNGPKHRNDLHRNFNNVECTVSLVDGLVPPGSPQVPDQYACTTDEGDAIFFDGDASSLLGAEFVTGETRISLAPTAMSTDGKISVEQAMKAQGSSRNIFTGNRRKLTTTGTKKVLVILVTNGVDKPSQSEQDMYNDVFEDDNNLVSAVSVAIR